MASIAILISYLNVSATYDTVASAKEKQGKFVHLIAQLDRTQPVEYDAIKNPNYLSFIAMDSLGGKVKVVYKNAKPDNLEHSERLVLKGTMDNDHFNCKEIMMKCPSKYNDDPKKIQNGIDKSSGTVTKTYSVNDSTEKTTP